MVFGRVTVDERVGVSFGEFELAREGWGVEKRVSFG